MRLSEFIKREAALRSAGINDPHIFKAMFLAGGGGSGKGFIGAHMFAGTGLKFLNSDLSFEFLLKRRGLSLKIDPSNPEVFEEQMRQRDKAQHMEQMQHMAWTNGMLGLVIDGTAKNFEKVKAARAGLEAMGYDTGMVFVNTTLEVALERNKKRERTVPEEVAIQAWNATQANIGRFQGLFGPKNFFIVDNSRVLDKDESDRLGMSLRKKALGWLSRPLENPVGKEIVHKLRAIGGKTISDLNKAVEKAASFKRGSVGVPAATIIKLNQLAKKYGAEVKPGVPQQHSNTYVFKNTQNAEKFLNEAEALDKRVMFGMDQGDNERTVVFTNK